MDKGEFYIIKQEVLPKVFQKVIEAKFLLETGKVTTVNEAAERVGISRSTYYKYKDAVFSFTEGSRGKIITLALILDDLPGVLSNVLNIIARSRANILTINQNIPIHGMANATISIDTREMEYSGEILMQTIYECPGVRKIDIIAQE